MGMNVRKMPGGREQTVSDKEILQFFIDSDDPVLFTGEVADFLDFSLGGARDRLKDLSSRDLLDMKKGGRVPVWWITDEGRSFVASSD